jgi:hypothetical protein
VAITTPTTAAIEDAALAYLEAQADYYVHTQSHGTRLAHGPRLRAAENHLLDLLIAAGYVHDAANSDARRGVVVADRCWWASVTRRGRGLEWVGV